MPGQIKHKMGEATDSRCNELMAVVQAIGDH